MEKTTTAAIIRSEFSDRLRTATAMQPYSRSPTALALEFNRRFPHLAVTSYAVRKWIIGEAIPTQEKILALAVWLDVDPAWLRFGDPSTPSLSQSHPQTHDGIERDVCLLNDAERKVLRIAIDAIFSSRKLYGRLPL